jgi:hypothetical protein
LPRRIPPSRALRVLLSLRERIEVRATAVRFQGADLAALALPLLAYGQSGVWITIGILLVVLLIVVIAKLLKR